MANKSKGSDFERELCKLFSLWWSFDERDDLFWRSAGSGGRATNRTRRGVGPTIGHYGDLAATDHTGEDLLRAITWEFKRGYTKDPIQDVADRPMRGAATTLRTWDLHLGQAISSHNAAGSYAWAMVAKRDHRPAWVVLPRYLCRALRTTGAMAATPRPFMAYTAEVRLAPTQPGTWLNIVGVTLGYWFANVRPFHIRRLLERVGDELR